MTECTTMDCAQPTDLYLCGDCVRDLQAWIEKAWHLLPTLGVTIAKLDVISRASEGGYGGKAVSAAPMNIDAWQIRENLSTIDRPAAEYAKDQFAAGIAWTIKGWVEKAEAIVDLPVERFVYGNCGADIDGAECLEVLAAEPDRQTVICPACDTTHRVEYLIDSLKERARGKPMPPADVRKYLQQEIHISVSRKDIENWAQLGHIPYVLDRVTTGKRPPRAYFPGDVLATHQRMKGRRRAA